MTSKRSVVIKGKMKNGLALVIGNANYALKEHRLVNAVNDASDIADRLVRLGFDVIKITNCKSDEFHRSTVEFSSKLLYEIYFNSKGKFRMNNFRNQFITELCSLQTIEIFKPSFDFIQKHLRPFHDYLFYIPTSKPKALPIELIMQKVKPNKKRETVYEVRSIKYEDTEVLHYDIQEGFYKTLVFDKFISSLCKELTVPRNLLRISSNMNLNGDFVVKAPFEFKLSKQNPFAESSEKAP